jgi:hypothetical protein
VSLLKIVLKVCVVVGGGGLEREISDCLWLSFRLALAKPNKSLQLFPFVRPNIALFGGNPHILLVRSPFNFRTLAAFLLVEK